MPTEVDLCWDLASQIQAADLPRPLREWPVRSCLRPTHSWRPDFVWTPQRLLVNLHTPHARPCRERNNDAAIAGWRVLYVTGAQIQSGEALRRIRLALEPLVGAAKS